MPGGGRSKGTWGGEQEITGRTGSARGEKWEAQVREGAPVGWRSAMRSREGAGNFVGVMQHKECNLHNYPFGDGFVQPKENREA